MIDGLKKIDEFNIQGYFDTLHNSPIKTIMLILDIAIVLFLAYKLLQIVKDTRAGQLVKGIVFLIIVTVLSSIIGLNILNYILTSFMTYGILAILVIFQPELRRGLEQLGTNRISKYFGLDKSVAIKVKENIYKISSAVMELASSRTGALIVIQRDIKLQDIVNNGVTMNAEISPQLLINIFTPKTPLHDGAVMISDNKLTAAACMLPLASDEYIAKELGTRHRAAIGISKETDAIAIVVSEETGKVSIAKDGTLIADLKEETLKKLLIKNIITEKLIDERKRKGKSKQKSK